MRSGALAPTVFIRSALLWGLLTAMLALGCAINPIPTPGSGGSTTAGEDVMSAPDIVSLMDLSEPACDVSVMEDIVAASDTPSPFDVPAVGDAEVLQPCQTLDEETLQALVISMESDVDMLPGASHDFGLGTAECCYYIEPVEAICVSWSVWPERAGASIDPVTGELSIHENTPHGTAFTVTADIEDGRRVLTIGVNVYTLAGNPLVGTWHEVAQLDCDDGQSVAVDEGMLIGELRFRAGGEYLVTWWPFEVYVDYWGSYTFDLETGALVLGEPEGNYVPADLDREGRFSFSEEGDLSLHDLWLGSPQEPADAARNCGHVFSR